MSKKSVQTQSGVITMESPYKLSYSGAGKTIVIDIAIHVVLKGLPNALVYFPLKPKWNAPFADEPIAPQLTDTISDEVESALTQMGYNVKFCLPMGA
jgi:hypothetical protein